VFLSKNALSCTLDAYAHKAGCIVGVVYLDITHVGKHYFYEARIDEQKMKKKSFYSLVITANIN
jgi:hypothetical protein